ncbi:sulfotransferase 4A1 [Lethenteron reissneri]|uniref:sulfotransferase 4A1 n=1 Tax=Lethenteron reissneri TaxID=7753 RepID=UPI002AB7019E|nr:sulfotransferase 4A1 [Lethenteron reissneri]XP_061426513.1 sulfotransferase 4A1 [Lethenteron reissneri]
MAESEVETPSTPSELLENRYFEFNNVRLPPFCRGIMDEILAFPVREDDIWVVTYPKSGTSLLQEVVFLVSHGTDVDESALMNIDDHIPVLEYPQPGLDAVKVLPSPRIIKSHLPYQFLPKELQDGKARLVYMARNPKDLVVSYYQFHRSLRSMSYRGTFQDFCRRFIYDKLGYGSWFEHVQDFWAHRNDENILFVKYEDLHMDLPRVLGRLSSFLGVSYERAHLEGMVAYCQQIIDHCCNTDALPISRVGSLQQGRVGLWKDIFTVSMNERFDSVYRQKLGKSDLTFDFQV